MEKRQESTSQESEKQPEIISPIRKSSSFTPSHYRSPTPTHSQFNYKHFPSQSQSSSTFSSSFQPHSSQRFNSKLGDLQTSLEMSIQMLENEEIERTYDLKQMQNGIYTTKKLEESITLDQDEFRQSSKSQEQLFNEQQKDQKLFQNLEISKRKIERDLADSRKKVSLLKYSTSSHHGHVLL